MIASVKRLHATLRRHQLLYSILFVFVLSLPMILYTWSFAFTNRHGILPSADWDEFAQMYEAARISIIKYHQFPWWNSWSVGGEPLFGNPQFGLFSIPMILVLLFGTVVGLHFSVAVYFILGFWGMYLFLQRIGTTDKIIAILLSYIWTFSGFATLHMVGGHLTFAVYLLAPWAFWALLNIKKRFGWLWFSLIIALFINTAPHYLTIETILISIPIAIWQALKQYKLKQNRSFKQIFKILSPYIYASIAGLLLTGTKLLFTFQFLYEFPRKTGLDPAVPTNLFLAALGFRESINPAALAPNAYGWVEYGNYIGIITLGLFAYLLVRKLEKPKTISRRDMIIVSGIFLATLLTLGAFFKLSPYSIMHELPLFDQMRVPSRFICWVGFGIIVFLANLPRGKFIYILLVISAVDVFSANYRVLNYAVQKPYIAPRQSSRQFEQYEFFDVDPALGQVGVLSTINAHLLRSTQNNYGEIYGYEPVLNIGEYYYLPGTIRCGINKGCSFVLTNNAKVIKWSPHEIILKRTGQGPIKLNMNPGKVWRINGSAPFASYKILELNKEFLIEDPSQDIIIKFTPTL